LFHLWTKCERDRHNANNETKLYDKIKKKKENIHRLRRPKSSSLNTDKLQEREAGLRIKNWKQIKR